MLRGPTSSGKTTLAENLRAILQPAAGQASPVTSTCVLHQDDFCPPKDQMPFNEKWQVTDWDTPHGSVRARSDLSPTTRVSPP